MKKQTITILSGIVFMILLSFLLTSQTNQLPIVVVADFSGKGIAPETLTLLEIALNMN